MYRRVVHAAPSGTLLLDVETLEVEYANLTAAELGDYEPEALVRHYPSELHDCSEGSSLREQLAPLRSTDAWPINYTTPSTESAPALDVQVQRIIYSDGGASILWKGQDVQAHQVSSERLRTVVELERHAVAGLRVFDR